MPLADVARAHYATQAGLARRAVEDTARLWAELDVTDLAGSWAALRLGERLFVALAALQLAAASFAARYLAAALVKQRAPSAPVAQLAPRSLAGVASDGRDLETLVFEPVIRVKSSIRDGATPRRAMEMGGSSLATIAGNQVTDAGRAGVAVAMAVEPAVTGWVRMLVPPSCGRCAILAGRRYRYTSGFLRHPLCDCQMIPSVEDTGEDLRTDPKAYFESLSAADQDRYFGVANARAIRDGGDVNRVVNASGRASGMSTAGGQDHRHRVDHPGIYKRPPP